MSLEEVIAMADERKHERWVREGPTTDEIEELKE